MITAESSFAIMLTLSCLAAAYVGIKWGKEFALGAGIGVSLLAGTWFQVEIRGTDINVTMATAAILLIVYACHSWRQIFRNVHALDCLMVVLMYWTIIVDMYHGGSLASVFVYSYGLWMLPYAAGRYSFVHADTFSKLAPLFATIVFFISITSVIESLTQVNLWEWLFCTVDDKVTRVKGLRFGLLYRAIGPTRNPIFLGIVFIAMLPFLIECATRTTATKSKLAFGLLGLAVTILGIIATVSRGPIICLGLIVAFSLAVSYRFARWSFVALAACLLIGFAAFPERTLQLLEEDGSGRTSRTVIQLDDSNAPEIYTGTRQRLLVPRIYGPIVASGGLFGFGSVDSSGFPPRNIPGLPTDPRTREMVRNVDNSYINVGLAFGVVGMTLFFLMWVCAIAYSLRLVPIFSTYFYPSQTVVAVVLSGVFFSLAFQVFTVHWSYDFGFWILYVVGMIAGLTSRYKGVQKGIA